jgi:hypothetical protein
MRRRFLHLYESPGVSNPAICRLCGRSFTLFAPEFQQVAVERICVDETNIPTATRQFEHDAEQDPICDQLIHEPTGKRAFADPDPPGPTTWKFGWELWCHASNLAAKKGVVYSKEIENFLEAASKKL